MYCVYCGGWLPDAAKFCNQCGKVVKAGSRAVGTAGSAQASGTAQASGAAQAAGATRIAATARPMGNARPAGAMNNNMAYQNQTAMMAKSSLTKVANMAGYYCFKCGCYVDRIRAAQYGDLNCRFCGASIIGPNYLSYAGNALTNFGFLGSLVAAGISATRYDNPERYVHNYYTSNYYNQTHYLFEVVATDKGKMGEYLVDVAYQQLLAARPGIQTRIYYNLQIPERDGQSFQEIDALMIFGGIIFVIEAKNRSGNFMMSHISDHDWKLYSSDGSGSVVYNPLMQNNEHISALDHYLYEKADLDINPYYLNYVVLAGDGDINWNMSTDTIDTLRLGPYQICKNSALAQSFIEQVDQLLNAKARGEYDNYADMLGPQHMAKIEKALLPLINMTEEQKMINMRHREQFKYKKFPYSFFYAEGCAGRGLLIKSNGLYIMGLWPEGTYMVSMYDAFEIKGDSICWKDQEIGKMLVRLDDPIDICDAYECVRQGRQYVLPEKYRQKSSGQDSQDQNAGRKRKPEPDQNISVEEMFFAGCDNLDTLNARYRNLCKTFHPDGQSGDSDTFKKMHAAYEHMKSKLSA